MEALLRNIILVNVAFLAQTVSAVDCDLDCYYNNTCCALYDCCDHYPGVDNPDCDLDCYYNNTCCALYDCCDHYPGVDNPDCDFVCSYNDTCCALYDCCADDAYPGLSVGAIVGIAIGPVVFMVILCLFIRCCVLYLRARKGVPSQWGQVVYPPAQYAYPQGGNSPYTVQQQIQQPQQQGGVPAEMLQQQQPYAYTNPQYPQQGAAVPVEMLQPPPYADTNPQYPVKY